MRANICIAAHTGVSGASCWLGAIAPAAVPPALGSTVRHRAALAASTAIPTIAIAATTTLATAATASFTTVANAPAPAAAVTA